eukprot:g19035.t1
MRGLHSSLGFDRSVLRLGLAPQHIVSTEPLPVARLKRPTPAQAIVWVVRNQPVVIEDAVNADDFPPFFDFADHR